MSSLSELKEYVAAVSEEAFCSVCQLKACEENLRKLCGVFSSLSATTCSESAKQVERRFEEAEKDVRNAAEALLIAANAGRDWSEGCAPVRRLVRR